MIVGLSGKLQNIEDRNKGLHITLYFGLGGLAEGRQI